MLGVGRTRTGVVVLGLLLAVVSACSSASPKQSALCELMTAQAGSAPTAVPGPGAPVVVLGDSWTSGAELRDPAASFAHLLVRARGWNGLVEGWPGTGYLNAGACGNQRFLDRVGAVPHDAGMVVIEGGLNDGAHPEQLPSAAHRLLVALAERAPRARLVVMGIPTVPAMGPAVRSSLDTALRQVAAQDHAQFVPLDGLSLPIGPDGIHPTDVGHAQLAGYLASTLAPPN